MWIALGLALQLQATAPSASPAQRRQDSIASAKFIKQIRREEAKFLADWRYEAQKLRGLTMSDPRYWSLHCHYDDLIPVDDELHLIHTEYSRKSMCPIWFQGWGERPDESITIDNGIPLKSRDNIPRKRAAVPALLDSAARLAPNGWVTGQRVRLYVDQLEYATAARIATDECRDVPAICALYQGYAFYSNGNRRRAEASFEFALKNMTPANRCGVLDIGVFLSPKERDAYDKKSCA